MPSFTVKLLAEGAVVRARITPHGNQERELVIRGVLDTGADRTFIDTSVVQLLDLKPVGTTLVYSLTTGPRPVLVNVYHLTVEIFGANDDEPGLRQEILAVSTDLFRLHVNGNQAMFGRDVLENCVFTYNGVLGAFSLGY